MSIAARVRELRERLGYSQEDLARAAGLVVSTVSHIEQGRAVNPSWDTMRRLALALGVRAEALDDSDPPADVVPLPRRARKGKRT